MKHQLTTDNSFRLHKLDELTIQKLARAHNRLLPLTQKIDGIAVFIQNDTVRINTINILKTILAPAIKNSFKIFESRDFPSLEQSSQLLDKNFLLIQRFVTINGLQRDLQSIEKSVSKKKAMANLIPYFYAGEPIGEPKIRSLLVKLGGLGVQTVVFDNIATFTQESVELILSSIKDLLESKEQEKLRGKEEKTRKKNQREKLLKRGSEMLLRAKRESDQQENLRLYKEAERCFTEAIGLMEKQDIEGFIRRGDAYFSQQKFSLAMNDYRDAVQQRSDSVEVHAKCGITLYKMAEGYLREGNLTIAKELYAKGKGMIKEAERQAAKPSKLQDTDSFSDTPSPFPRVLSAILEIESVDLSPINEDVSSDLAELKENVIKVLPDSGETGPGNLETNLTLADVNLQVQNFDKAKEILEKIFPEAPYIAVPVYNKLGSVYRQAGEFGRALHVYLDILRFRHEIQEEESIVTINCFLALNHFTKKMEESFSTDTETSLDTVCNLVKVLTHLSDVDFMNFEEASIKYQATSQQKLPPLPFETVLGKPDFIKKYAIFLLDTLPPLVETGKKTSLTEETLEQIFMLTQLIAEDKYLLFSENEKEKSLLKQAVVLSTIQEFPSLMEKLKMGDPEAEALSSLARITVMKPALDLENRLEKGEIKKVQLLLSSLMKRTSALLDKSLGIAKK
ncbi:MAG: tetratricopeptide repeat protein [Nitrospinota bacterium]